MVAGIRTPQDLTETARIAPGPTSRRWRRRCPRPTRELVRIYGLLESHYRDMQDMEFTVERGKLWMLQTRSGKRTAKAALRIAVDLASEGLITQRGGGVAHRSGLARPAPPSHPGPAGRAAYPGERPAGLARRGLGRDRLLLGRRRGRKQGRAQGHPGAGRDLARRTSTACMPPKASSRRAAA